MHLLVSEEAHPQVPLRLPGPSRPRSKNHSRRSLQPRFTATCNQECEVGQQQVTMTELRSSGKTCRSFSNIAIVLRTLIKIQQSCLSAGIKGVVADCSDDCEGKVFRSRLRFVNSHNVGYLHSPRDVTGRETDHTYINIYIYKDDSIKRKNAQPRTARLETLLIIELNEPVLFQQRFECDASRKSSVFCNVSVSDSSSTKY